MKKLMYVLIFMPLLGFAEDKDGKDYSIIPLAAYEFVSLENRQYHAPGGGLVFMKGDQAPPVEEERDSLMVAAFYQSYLLKENQSGYPDVYHAITSMAERKIKRRQMLGLFRSLSDKPVYGGLRTFQAALGYGYELVRNSSVSLTLGAAVGISEFDIGGDVTVPAFPFPLKNPMLFSGSLAQEARDAVGKIQSSGFVLWRGCWFSLGLLVYSGMVKPSMGGKSFRYGVGQCSWPARPLRPGRCCYGVNTPRQGNAAGTVFPDLQF
jgi:hypothetical protein